MKILAVGSSDRCLELKKKMGADHLLEVADSAQGKNLDAHDLVLDLNLDDHASLVLYAEKKSLTVIGCAVKKSLRQLIYEFNRPVKCTLIGMNALSTFIDRPRTEISLLKEASTEKLNELTKALGWECLVVEDRVGMVSPRVVCMLINEACYTLQEGTASLHDIDKAMKLGANYPYGPFEWCDLIGIKDVYETLLAIWNDMHDERHKICPLLKSKYLNREKFYSQL